MFLPYSQPCIYFWGVPLLFREATLGERRLNLFPNMLLGIAPGIPGSSLGQGCFLISFHLFHFFSLHGETWETFLLFNKLFSFTDFFPTSPFALSYYNFNEQSNRSQLRHSSDNSGVTQCQDHCFWVLPHY